MLIPIRCRRRSTERRCSLHTTGSFDGDSGLVVVMVVLVHLVHEETVGALGLGNVKYQVRDGEHQENPPLALIHTKSSELKSMIRVREINTE